MTLVEDLDDHSCDDTSIRLLWEDGIFQVHIAAVGYQARLFTMTIRHEILTLFFLVGPLGCSISHTPGRYGGGGGQEVLMVFKLCMGRFFSNSSNLPIS